MDSRNSQLHLAYATKIKNGDELRNINSYEYLSNIFTNLSTFLTAEKTTLQNDSLISDFTRKYGHLINDISALANKSIQEITSLSSKYGIRDETLDKVRTALQKNKTYELFNHGKYISDNGEEISHSFISLLNSMLKTFDEEYNPSHAYGDDYTTFITECQKYIPDLLKKEINKNFKALLKNIVKNIYLNENQALERAALMMKGITDSKKNFQEIEHDIIKKMKGGNPSINKITPQDQESTTTRLLTMVGDYDNQRLTNLASLKKYEHHDEQSPTECRFGTQGQYTTNKEAMFNSPLNKIATINPLFKIFLDTLKAENLDKKTIYIYFNNLKRTNTENPSFNISKSAIELNREGYLTAELEKLNTLNTTVTVITLPADNNLMNKKFISPDNKDKLSFHIIENIKNMAMKNSIENDIYIPPEIKERLYPDNTEDATLNTLLNNSLKKLGLDNKNTFTNAEQIAITFHFFKFELTNHIIKTLEPLYFNISCKDAIDRGGISSLYYNLIKSIESGKCISKKEFYRDLNGACITVKGRGLNEHAALLYTAIYFYVKNNNLAVPQWLHTWLETYPTKNLKDEIENCNQKSIKNQLNDSIEITEASSESMLAMFKHIYKSKPCKIEAKRALLAHLEGNSIEQYKHQVFSLENILQSLNDATTKIFCERIGIDPDLFQKDKDYRSQLQGIIGAETKLSPTQGR